MRWFIACAFVFFTAGAVGAADHAALTSLIDSRLADEWSKAKIRPAELSNDAEFLRRATLDLSGRIPTVSEVHAFLSDERADKRQRFIERVCDSAEHARQMALFWRKSWLPQTSAIASFDDGTDEWFTTQFQANARYDKIVQALLTVAPAEESAALRVPRSFFFHSDELPATLAANAARVFLGINLDCAQCHDHPFDAWTRDQFWQTAAFFAPPDATDRQPRRLEVMIPGTSETVGARFLTSTSVALPQEGTDDAGRRAFAQWLADRDNPYFARNAMNRLWAYLFGAGLVEPLDTLSRRGAAESVPGLLDELTRAFVESDFDLQYVTRAIVLSRVYQLSQLPPDGEEPTEAAKLFSRAEVRALSGEQLYDSLRVAAGYNLIRPGLDPPAAAQERSQFAAKFSFDGPNAAERSIIQALMLMNGGLINTLTSADAAPLVVSVAEAPFLDAPGRIEALFLATYSRRPTADESAELVRYLEGSGDARWRQRLAEVFWALLNSAEFNTNH